MTTWRSTPKDLTLAPDFVDIWRSPVDLPAMQRLALQQCLSPLEIERADRYRVMARREEFIVARGLLRTILGRLLAADPRAIEFTFSIKGKPAIDRPETGRAISFNLSHSHGLILIAATLGRSVGVDVELVREQTDFERMAERFFSPVECEVLRSVEEKDRRRAFFTCWTRKEAFLKATGMGITVALDSFDVEYWPPDRASLLALRQPEMNDADWTMRNVPVGGDHAASVAVEGPAIEMRHWEVW